MTYEEAMEHGAGGGDPDEGYGNHPNDSAEVVEDEVMALYVSPCCEDQSIKIDPTQSNKSKTVLYCEACDATLFEIIVEGDES